MPTPVSSARQCLAGEAAAALDDAVSVARRRQHAQTTSLHVVFALLSSPSSNSPSSASTSASSSPSPLLRDALSRARSSAYSPRLQFKALELCFGVALDRLPSSSISSSSSCSASAEEPPVSNSLMAAIKRSQANQRRHPDTFHFYQQQQLNASSSSFAGVKVELQQLILAILDDPVVSRVFGEAGFRSSDIKLAVMRPPPPILRFPLAARCPPLFLCNFSTGDDFESVNLTPRGFSFPFSDGGDDNCRRIGEIISRKINRNPMLVGVGAGDAVRDFVRAIEKQNCGFLPPELANLKFVSLEKELLNVREMGDSMNWIKGRLEELGRAANEEARVLIEIGDLNGWMDLGDDLVNCLVLEMTRVLESCRERLWVIGWSATYETYMKFLSKYPTLDKDWDLQLQLITPARPAMGGLVSRAPSLTESFVPFGGFFPTAYEPNIPAMKPYSSAPRCQLCNDKCEQELAAVLKGCTPSCEDQGHAKLPSWLQSVDTVRMNSPLDASKVKDDVEVLNARVAELQKKWNDHCQRLHQGFLKPEANKSSVLPPIIGIPYVSDKVRSINPSIINLGVTQSQCGLGSALPVTVGLQKMTTASHGMLLPVASEPANKDLISKLQVGVSRSDQPRTEDLKSNQSALSELSTHDDRNSPSSVTSVTTDLVLGTFHEPCAKELARCSPSKKVIDFGQHQPLSAPKAFLSSANMSGKVDPSNFRAFYNSFREKVCRQDAAISAISLAIIQCKAGHERRQRASLKGDIWLSFLGPDRFGKKRAATALAELMFGSRENMISIDLGYQDSIVGRNSICNYHEINKHDINFRGTQYTDRIAEEISKRPSSVVFLENLEKADFMVQDILSQAIRTGKINDRHGRGIGINNAIFVVTTDTDWGKKSSPGKEGANFCEDNILAAQRWQMKISIESTSEVTSRHPPINVAINWRQESKNKLVANKRKLDLSDCHVDQQRFSDSPKRAHKISKAFLDLNLPVEEEVVENDADVSSSSNSSSGDEQWVEEFLKSMDENVKFEPFDFDTLADYAVKEISKRFCNTFGSECFMEIDKKAMEQILAATWLLEDRRDLNNWFENVLLGSFFELRQRYSNKLSARSIVKLSACEDTFSEDHAPGLLLPSRIILD